MGIFTSGLKFIGKNVAAGALSEVGSYAAGSILDKICGGPDDKVAEEIKQIGQQLTNIQKSMEVLKKELQDIENQLEKIVELDIFITWQNVDLKVMEYVTKIATQYDRFIEYANNPKTTSEKEVDELVKEILDTNVGAEVNLMELRTLILSSSELEKGVLQLWTEMVIPHVGIGNDKILYGQAIEYYYNYYIKIAYAQVQAANLLVEAFNKDKNQPVAKDKWQSYRDMMKDQEVPFLINIDQILGAVLTYENYPVTGSHPTVDFWTAAQVYFPCGVWKTHYTPSTIHTQAETILANAQAMGPDERRIVIWAVYPNKNWSNPPLPIDDLNNVKLQLECVSNKLDNGIDADYSDVIEGPPCDRYNQKHFIKRFIYSTTKDGTYKMKDKNGQDGLIDIHTCYQDPCRFQDPSCLAYTMNVNALQEFDFMDFTVYNDPTL
jgi:hypothetical protein